MDAVRTFFDLRAQKSWAWFKERAHGPHAKAWLLFLSFTESSFLLIAPDILLIAILLAGARRWVYYAGITTIASTLGGVFGYLIGALFFDTLGVRIIDLYNLEDEIVQVGGMFKQNAFWVIFTAAFTPIPYKVFVLAGGFFKIHFLVFLLASLLGRGLRFYLVAYIVQRFGEHFVRLFMRYFTLGTLALLLLFLAWVAVKFDLLPFFA